MKTIVRVFAWLLGAAALVIGGLFAALVWWGGSAPTPDELKKHFVSKRPALEALVQLMKADGREGFCLGGAGLKEMEAHLTPARIEEYRARMKEAEVRCVFGSPESVEISVWAVGMPGTEHSKGFIWSQGKLPNEFVCIMRSCFPPGFKPKRFEKVHERIDPEWALYSF